MEKVQKELKVLKYMKDDIELRIKKGQKDEISQRLQKFIIKISILERSIDLQNLDLPNQIPLIQEIENLKSASNDFQKQINNYTINSSKSQEDEILQNLETLKEISKEILSELCEQNKLSLKSLKTMESSEETILKARSRLSRLEKFLDCLPTACLVVTMSLTFLLTILVLSIL
jgi:hypothetical protein